MSDDVAATAPEAPVEPAAEAPHAPGPDPELVRAVGEVAERRRQRGRQPSLEDGTLELRDVAIEYTDKATAPESLTPREAAADLTAWREQQRERAQAELAELVGDDGADEAATQQQPQAAQPDGAQPEAGPQRLTEQQQLELVRGAQQKYAEAVGQNTAILANVILAEFPDIQTQRDLDNLAATNPTRHARAVALQTAIHRAQAHMQQTEVLRQQREAEDFEHFAQQQDAMAMQVIPELKSPEARAHLQSAVVDMLNNIGVSTAEIKALYHGDLAVSFRDVRAQRILADAARYRMAMASAKQTQARPLPPVQRPGVRQDPGAANEVTLQALSDRLTRTGSAKDAAALVARRASRRSR